MKLIYGINDKPQFSKTLIFAFQQMIAIMAATPDTNLIHRGGMEAQNWVWESLKTNPNPADLCPEFEKRNLSPGGSADLLAAACFLHFCS